MNSQRIPELKRQMLQMEDTKEESDNMIKNPELVEENFEKIREKLHWKITLNYQVEFIGQYILYELIQTQKYFDLYRGIKLSNRERVIIKIIDKSAIKLGLIENEFLSNWQEEYEEFIQKLKIEHEASVALMNQISSIFMIESGDVYGNADCAIRVTENYHDEPLSKILLRRGSLTVEQALAVVKQVTYTLSQLHKQNIILTELNPEFIVYKNGVFKISDFSSMRKVGSGFTSTLNLYSGYTYQDLIAPELTICPQIVDIKSQIWAIGVLFYHMIAHSVSYEERGINIVKKAKSHNITVQTRTGPASQKILNFLKHLLQTDPDQRISWKKLVNHPLFQKKQYFNTLKMMPIVDVRCDTLKRKEKDMIQQEMYNNDFINSPNKKRKFNSKIEQINQKVLFKIVDQDRRINMSKSLDIEAETFFFIQQTNLMALKALYIYNQILVKIKEYNLIDTKRRSHLETIFLISERCYHYARRAKNYQSKAGDRRVDNYLEQIKKIFEEIKQFFISTRSQYESVEKSTYYISNDIFAMLKNNSKQKERSKMLKGKEGVDFSVQDNIKFTQQKCINRILPEMKGDRTRKDSIYVLECVKLNLKNYQKINSITLNDLKTEHCFSDVVTKVITAKIKFI